MMSVGFRSRCVTFLRYILFANVLRCYVTKQPAPYWFRLVFFHRAVSIFDRFCQAEFFPISRNFLSDVLAGCAVLGCSPCPGGQKGKFYVAEIVEVLRLSNCEWCMNNVRLSKAARGIASNLSTVCPDPRLRGERDKTSICCFKLDYGDTVRGLFDVAQLNHRNDLQYLKRLVHNLRAHSLGDVWYMSMYLMDLCLQSQLVFQYECEYLVDGLYLYACLSMGTELYGAQEKLMIWGGAEGVLDAFRELFDHLSMMRRVAARDRKKLYDTYSRSAYKCVGARGKYLFSSEDMVLFE